MKFIIPTRGRADVIGKKALRLFPDATLCVGADEVEPYRRLSENLLVRPPEVVGVRQEPYG
jgi:hypothetical protein